MSLIAPTSSSIGHTNIEWWVGGVVSCRVVSCDGLVVSCGGQ